MLFSSFKQIVLALSATLFLGACAVVPKHLDNAGEETDTHFLRDVILDNQTVSKFSSLRNEDFNRDVLGSLTSPLFSRGDWVKVKIHSMPDFDGLYQIDTAGNLELPFNPSLNVVGLNRDALVALIQQNLMQQGWFNDEHTLVNVSLVRPSSIEVSVFGAVFNQGRITINGKSPDKPEDPFQHETGSYAPNRDLVAALRSAGGVRPDADLSRVMIKRGKTLFLTDITSLLNGLNFDATPSLIHGDEVYVASLGEEDTNLIRPTQITPPGMRVLMSNLTAPALSNALSSVSADATRLPYGSSLLDAAVSSNCVGGTHQANASRSIILITRHYGDQQQIVIRRSINQLLADSSDYSINPYLMPNDGIACYDSKFTNLRDVARGIGELFGPAILGGLL